MAFSTIFSRAEDSPPLIASILTPFSSLTMTAVQRAASPAAGAFLLLLLGGLASPAAGAKTEPDADQGNQGLAIDVNRVSNYSLVSQEFLYLSHGGLYQAIYFLHEYTS
jgi:hypothetical protein